LITWTIGAGGLLGSALQRRSPENFQAAPVPWADTQQSIETLKTTAERFQQEVGDREWAVIWAAGHATTSSSRAETADELATFTAVTQAVRDHLPTGSGAFFVTSSAGGLYAGSEHPPFSELTKPQPLSAYGELKLAQEAQATRELDGVCPVVIGRIANLYGPGQNLDKLQGLVSRLTLSAITKQPINIFVSLDTMRDYIYADDAAAVVLYRLQQAITDHRKTTDVQVIGSGQPVSLGHLIHLVQDVVRTRIPVAYGVHASSAAQALDLRVHPTNLGEVEALIQTSLPAGTKRVYLDLFDRYQLATAAR